MTDKIIINDEIQGRRGRFFIFFTAAFAIIAVDQWTKWLVRRDIPLGVSWLPEWLEWLSPYVRFLHIQNRGASFGMFQDGNLIFIIVSLLIVCGILFYVTKMEHDSKWMWVAAGLYLGGAVGNLIDRVLFGAVTDFISVGTFYIFNIADASINVSVAMLVILVWMSERKTSISGEESKPDDHP